MNGLQYPDYAKDNKLNAGRILAAKDGSDLDSKQVAAITLASAYATRNITLINAAKESAHELLSATELMTIKTVATIMASNNIYYRYIHNINAKEIKMLPAGLRMQGLRSEEMAHTDIELCGLAASAINNCGLCMSSHTDSLLKLGVSPATIQHAVQIAAVVGANAQVLTIEEADK